MVPKTRDDRPIIAVEPVAVQFAEILNQQFDVVGHQGSSRMPGDEHRLPRLQRPVELAGLAFPPCAERVKFRNAGFGGGGTSQALGNFGFKSTKALLARQLTAQGVSPKRPPSSPIRMHRRVGFSPPLAAQPSPIGMCIPPCPSCRPDPAWIA